MHRGVTLSGANNPIPATTVVMFHTRCEPMAVFEHWLEHACPQDFSHLDPGSLGFMLKDMVQSCTRKVGAAGEGGEGREVQRTPYPICKPCDPD
jgi:hypothetical protein